MLKGKISWVSYFENTMSNMKRLQFSYRKWGRKYGEPNER